MIAQLIIDLAKKNRKNNTSGFLIQTLFQVVRKIYLKVHKTALIKYKLDKYEIMLPLKHDLPIMKRNYPAYDTHIGRISMYINEKYKEFQVIDIGANIGDSAIIIKSKVDVPILCIEPDDYYYSLLEANTKNINGITCEKKYIGDSETSDLKLVQFKGTARLVKDRDTNSGIRFYSLQEIIEKHPKFNKVKFLKIDTDGFDCKIIRSSSEFLAQSTPVIFFEYDPYFLSTLNDDGLSVFGGLKKLGYIGALIYDNTGSYLISLNLDQELTLEELHTYFSGWKGVRYMDICVFHSVDMELFENARMNEIAFYKILKNQS